MNELICRQDAIEAMNCLNDSICEGQATEALCELPSVDAVEVVRCKDCVYGEYYSEASDEKMDWYYCNYTGGNWNLGKQFCSYGERKNDDSQMQSNIIRQDRLPND